MAAHSSKKFKQQIVDLHLQAGRSIPELCKDYNLVPSTVRRWVALAKGNDGAVEVVLTPLEEENQALKKQLKQLELENEILKQAALILGKK